MASSPFYTEEFLVFLNEHPELDELSDRILDELAETGEIRFFIVEDEDDDDA